ncbi:MAG: anti-sigma regulatory factor [Verrucomicrobia bacterium]|nr:anti-sigma regulatory factor [Verrucomicrobiota bacterium]
MTVLKSESFPIIVEQDIVRSRQMTREWAIKLGFRLVDQTKMVTAVSELARNTLVYGKGGFMLLEELEKDLHKGLRATFEDRGPGIPDIPLALKDGFSTGHSLGLGLGGSKRLSNEFEIISKVGEGTRVTIARWA